MLIRLLSGDPLRQFQMAMLALILLLVIGTTGYWLLGDVTVLQAVLMTVITVSTVGYQDYVKLDSPTEQLFTIFLILFAVIVSAWAVRSAAELLFAEFFWTYVGKQRMQKRIDELKGHVIVVGYGRMGRAASDELDAEGNTVVVVETSPESASDIRETGRLVVNGDGTRDETLQMAGVDRAKALIAVTDSDPTNVMVVLSARALNPELMIAARAADEEATPKLRRAGADYVLHHHGTGAMHMALAVTHPAVEEVLNLLIPRRGSLDLGQLEVTGQSSLAGRTLIELEPLRYGALVLALVRAGDLIVPPQPDTPLEAGDIIVVAGPGGALKQMRAQAGKGDVLD